MEADPHQRNYDEALANPFPVLPDPLQLKGLVEPARVANGWVWWRNIAREIVEDFEREVYGCVPDEMPEWPWTVKETRESTLADIPLIEQALEGTVDNAMCRHRPRSSSHIIWVLPKNAPGAVAGPHDVRHGRVSRWTHRRTRSGRRTTAVALAQEVRPVPGHRHGGAG